MSWFRSNILKLTYAPSSLPGYDAAIGERAENINTGLIYIKTGLAVTDWTLGTAAYGGGGGSVNSVSGTAGRISSTGGANPIIDLVNTAVTPASYTYGSFTVDAAGRLTAASSGAAPESPLTFSTGLTRAVNTITANLSTGVSGGQTAIGGTGASDNLALSSTSNGTKGKFVFGSTTGHVFNENTNVLSVGIDSSNPATVAHFKRTDVNGTNLYVENTSTGTSAYMGLTIGNNDAIFTGPYFGFWQTGASFTTVGAATASSAWFQLAGGSGNIWYEIHQNAGDHVWSTTTSATERMRLTNAGVLSVPNLSAGGIVKAAAATGILSIAAAGNVTGSRGGNAALASVLTALATHGLITDNSTP